MNVFVTVGTTSFDRLVKASDECASIIKEYDFIFQIADGSYTPLNGSSFGFVDSVDSYYNHSDIVITHAGAGSVYNLLELHKKLVVVPNLERVDKHQRDLAGFLEENNYALVVWDLDRLLNILKSVKAFQPAKFEKDPFFKYEEIASYLLS